jgi:acyl-CoA synthetase (AMP-forming)/AMP-acid ligase II
MIVAKIELIEPEKPLDLARRLREHCQNRLARYQIPSRFEVVDQLEQTHSGKLKRIS